MAKSIVVDVKEAAERLEEFLEMADQGKKVIISENGVQMVWIRPLSKEEKKRHGRHR